MQQEIRAKGVLNPRQEIGRSPWHHPPDFAAAGFERHEITGFPGPRGIFPGSPPGVKAMAGRPVAPGGAVTDEEPGCVTGMTLDPLQKICRQGKKTPGSQPRSGAIRQGPPPEIELSFLP